MIRIYRINSYAPILVSASLVQLFEDIRKELPFTPVLSPSLPLDTLPPRVYTGWFSTRPWPIRLALSQLAKKSASATENSFYKPSQSRTPASTETNCWAVNRPRNRSAFAAEMVMGFWTRKAPGWRTRPTDSTAPRPSTRTWFSPGRICRTTALSADTATSAHGTRQQESSCGLSTPFRSRARQATKHGSTMDGRTGPA